MILALLIDDVVQFCNTTYLSYNGLCGCQEGHCNHPSGKCSGSCYDCLYHIHFPVRAPENAKKKYDCIKMLCHYVCQYSYLYASELFCAFDYEWSYLKDFSCYNILSLGCGGCADLMAIEGLLQSKGSITPVSYMGIDVNNLWHFIHERIKNYCYNNNMRFKMYYNDVFQFFRTYYVNDVNVIVISYLISYLYNTDQTSLINNLAELLTERVKKKMKSPCLFIINDVNSNRRGRDYFAVFANAFRRAGLTICKSEYKYFDNGRLNEAQKLGTPYVANTFAFNVPNDIQNNYHAYTSSNSTVQLLVEVK